MSSYSVMTGSIEYVPFEYIYSYLSIGGMTPESLWVKVSLSYFVFVKTGNCNCWMSMISVSLGQSMIAVNPSAAFCRARVRSAGLAANMVVRSHIG